MKKILYFISIIFWVFFFSIRGEAINYIGTNITSWVFPDMISNTGFYLWYGGWAWEALWSNGKYSMFFRDTTNTGTTAYKSLSCFWLRNSAPTWDYYYDSTTNPRLALSYSGNKIEMNVYADDNISKILSGVVLATLTNGTGVTATDNHPNENVMCAVISYVLRTWSFFWNWRYLYSISTFHYISNTTIFNRYNFYDVAENDPDYGLRYSTFTNLMNPFYLNTSSVRYDFYFESSTISEPLWYTPERNSYRLQLLGDLLGSTNSGKLNNTFPNYYKSQNFTGSVIIWPNVAQTSSWSVWPDFSSCWSIEIWCHVSQTFSWIFNSYFPDFSFSQSFDSCSTGSTSSGAWIKEKMVRLITIINPIPPEEWALICGLFGSWYLDYSQASQSGNIFSIYAHGQVPEVLEWDWIVAYGQNILDIVLIIWVFILIFRPRKND